MIHELLSKIYVLLSNFLNSNQFASGGLILGIGALIYRSSIGYFKILRQKIYSSLISDIYISSYYDYTSHALLIKELTKILDKKRRKAFVYRIESTEQGIQFRCESGTWFLRLEGCLVKLTLKHSLEKGQSEAYSVQDIQVKCFRWNKEKIRSFISSAIDYNAKVIIPKSGFSSSEGIVYIGNKIIPYTNFNSIILDRTLQNYILLDIDNFLASKEKYSRLSIAYKRIYILYGPPGNGKTSFVKALSHRLNRHIIETNCEKLAELDTADRELKRSIILVEDIDREMDKLATAELFITNSINNLKPIRALAKTPRNSPIEASKYEGFTGGISKLLNNIDGIRGGDNLIIIFTANNLDKIDPALLRPGRIDIAIEFKNATRTQAERLANKFYGILTPKEKVLLKAKIEDYKYSMAQLQGHFLKYETVAEALNNEIDTR